VLFGLTPMTQSRDAPSYFLLRSRNTIPNPRSEARRSWRSPSTPTSSSRPCDHMGPFPPLGIDKVTSSRVSTPNTPLSLDGFLAPSSDLQLSPFAIVVLGRALLRTRFDLAPNSSLGRYTFPLTGSTHSTRSAILPRQCLPSLTSLDRSSN